MARTQNLVIEDARILYRNFSGKEGRFNPKGNRNFCILFPIELAMELKKEGWNIRLLDEDTEDARGILKVSVSFANYPPNIFFVTKNSKMRIGQNQLHMVDDADIDHADVVIRPYEWEVNGKAGVKAYLKDLYITVTSTVLSDKYGDLPETNSGANDDDPPFDLT